MHTTLNRCFSLGALFVTLLMAGTVAKAQIPSNIPGQWDAIVINGSTVVSSAAKTFTGIAVLSSPSLQIECELSLTSQATLDLSNDIAYIDAFNGDAEPGDFACNLISFVFPWNMYEDEFEAAVASSNTGLSGFASPDTLYSDVIGYLGNIDVSLLGCQGYTEVIFNNNGPSSSTLDFNGPIVGSNCTLVGKLYSQNGDINIY